MFEEEKGRKWGPERMEEICSSTWEALYRFIYYRVQNRQEAEDITQEAYTKALPHFMENKVKTDKYLGFLKVVSLNVLRDRWRKRKRQGVEVGLDRINPEESAVEDGLEDSVRRETIENALGTLNEEQRRVIRLRILEGYPVAETAKMMNKTEGAVRVLQYRALKALAELLRSDG